MVQRDDLEAIRTVHAQYGQLVDDLRLEELGDLFTEDAIWSVGDLRFEGRPEIVSGFAKIEPPKPGMVRHLSFPGIIDIDGNSAFAWVDAIALVVGEPSTIVAAGRYHDILRREGDRWRIARRVFVMSGTPVPDGIEPSPGPRGRSRQA